MKAWRHAFALEAVPQPFEPKDLALLEKVADEVVKRGMATPALILLESLGPLNFLGSQVLHGLRPVLELAFDNLELERAAQILERRESLSVLIGMIERKTR